MLALPVECSELLVLRHLNHELVIEDDVREESHVLGLGHNFSLALALRNEVQLHCHCGAFSFEAKAPDALNFNAECHRFLD